MICLRKGSCIRKETRRLSRACRFRRSSRRLTRFSVLRCRERGERLRERIERRGWRNFFRLIDPEEGPKWIGRGRWLGCVGIGKGDPPGRALHARSSRFRYAPKCKWRARSGRLLTYRTRGPLIGLEDTGWRNFVVVFAHKKRVIVIDSHLPSGSKTRIALGEERSVYHS